MASGERGADNLFARVATAVDGFFESRFYKVGYFVGSRPWTSLGLSFVLMLVCAGGFSQFNAENRVEKLWIPLDTRAQADQEAYTSNFPPGTRFVNVLLEAKDSDGALDNGFLEAAMQLHGQVENVSFNGNKLIDLCIPQPSDGHPCFISSVLSTWGYSADLLAADSDHLATLNSVGHSTENLHRLLGGATFDGSSVVSAKAMSIVYILRLDRELVGGSYVDEVGEGWEEELLDMLGCNDPSCSGDRCVCSFASEAFTLHALATRSWSDAFGSVVRGDVGIINGAFMLMILYLILNLGGLCHKIYSRALLAFMCILTIVASGIAGYGVAMWLQFDYSSVHSILPFVILGIGVDDSFVIMNALDRTDPSLAVSERIATALSHAGVSIMVTSLTDFIAFAISVSTSLPSLASFCMYASFSVLFLFIFQVTMFSALATLDLRRVTANRIDCCFCLPRGWFCCPTVPQDEAAQAIQRGDKDPNQMCCSAQPKHQGGRIGQFLEYQLAPAIVLKPVAAGILLVFAAFCGICAWQASELSVQDTVRSFIPDDSYVLTATEKNDEFFGALGTKAHLLTQKGDHFAAQRALVDLGPALDATGVASPTNSDSYRNWALGFKTFCEGAAASSAECVSLAIDADGFATDQSAYYTQLKAWLSGPGAKYQSDVIWNSADDEQLGIFASRIAFEVKSVNKIVNGEVAPDANHATAAMDALRAMCDAQTGLPGGKCIAYASEFLSWEVFRIILDELFLSVGLCLLAILLITMALIAHPLTSLFVFLCVVMTVVDIMGCMNMWGLAIDSVSVVEVVISVGLSVDYSAHVGHNFMKQVGTREERVVKTMGDVGAAVLCGGISTFLGVMLLAISKSYVFRVLFQTFFLTVVLGLAHGLILLPALLSLFGPASYRKEEPCTEVQVQTNVTRDKDAGAQEA